MKRVHLQIHHVQSHHVKDDNKTHLTSGEEAVPDVSRAHTQQGGGHRSGSSGAGTSEKLDREPERRKPRAAG